MFTHLLRVIRQESESLSSTVALAFAKLVRGGFSKLQEVFFSDGLWNIPWISTLLEQVYVDLMEFIAIKCSIRKPWRFFVLHKL